MLRSEEIQWHNSFSVVGLYVLEKLLSVTDFKIVLLQIIQFFLKLPNTQQDSISACESVRHSGTDIHSTGARSWRTRPVMLNTAGVSMIVGWGGSPQPTGSSAGGGAIAHARSWQDQSGKLSGFSSFHAYQPVGQAGSRAFAGVHCHGYSSTWHTTTWAGKPSGRTAASWHQLHVATWPSVTSLPPRTACRVIHLINGKTQNSFALFSQIKWGENTKKKTRAWFEKKNMQAMVTQEVICHLSTIL